MSRLIKFQSNKVKYFNRFLLLASILTASCGSEVKDKSCDIEFKELSKESNSAGILVRYQGDLSSKCQTLVNDNSGRLTVKLHAEAMASADVYLTEIKAGERNFSLGKDAYNFANSTLDNTFQSDTSTAWQVPWRDKPNTMSVGLAGPLSLTTASLPTRLLVQLSL